MAVELICTIASCAFRICGSGTSRTSICLVPIQQLAFIDSSLSGCVSVGDLATARTCGAGTIGWYHPLVPGLLSRRRLRWLPGTLQQVRALDGGLREHDFAKLHHLLEGAQVVVH